MEQLYWQEYCSSIACNGDLKTSVINSDDDKANESVRGKLHWEFTNDDCREFRNIHHAIELGWKLLAPPAEHRGYFRRDDFYEWWLVKD